MEPVRTNKPDDVEYPVERFLTRNWQNLLENITLQINLHIIRNHSNVFLAINLLMGIKRLPRHGDFWSDGII